jgi:hypothetical protein
MRAAQSVEGGTVPHPTKAGDTLHTGRLGDKVTIAEAWKRTSGMSLGDFKTKLLESYRGDHLTLSRMDRPDLTHTTEETEQSAIPRGGGDSFGYIHAPRKAGEAPKAPEPAPEPKPAAKETWKERDRREQKKWSETHTAQHDVEGLTSKIRAAGYDVRWGRGYGDDSSAMEIVQAKGAGAGKMLNRVEFNADGSVNIERTHHKTTTNLVADHLGTVHGDVERDRFSGRIRPKPGGAAKPLPTVDPKGSGTRLIPGKHTKHGHDIWTVQLGSRVDREKYNALAAKAKALGGYYSSFKGNGAIPGFIFKNPASARAFHEHASGGSEE